MRLTFLLPLNAPFSALRSDIIAQPETIYLLNEFYRKLTSLKEDRMRKINSALFKVRDRFFHKEGKKWKRDDDDDKRTIFKTHPFHWTKLTMLR